MSSDADAMALVRRQWALYQARRWDEAQTLFAPEAQCFWWATGEHFSGAAAIVRVNAIYPEGWALHLLELHALPDRRVHSLVRVDHGPGIFYANSFFRLEQGLIHRVDEYWADGQAAPAWRRDPAQAMWGRSELAADRRCGLDLTL